MRYFLISSLALLLACGTPTAVPTESFGARFEAQDVLPSTDLLTTYSEQQLADTVRTTLRATINEVCQAKGCWMTVAAGEAEEMMVKFRDYGFFVPMDISEREVILHGVAYYQVTSVEELRHYAEDAGQSEEDIARITTPKRELRFVADGVQLL
ncbi:hypothetical protein LEM8419_02624 [Neolewinella maritima]|uniref:DUF4920 domain-containing protein n=1 Tax=Neolewinella maritima TaxID=1383882 RepID=A0ABN8F439_9BACT|nr:DUF4920 domain-containing protein [Neolewinella maritima]CAH1001718.1 hypothetical protein LEM8419_02624 [Neolewinella maritima]